MDLQQFFTREVFSIYDVYGDLKAEESIHLTRQGISNNEFAHTHKFKALLIPETVISEGDKIVSPNNEEYLIMSMRKIQFMNTNQATAWLCDNTCSIYRLENKYINGKKAGKTLNPIIENTPCVQKDTNGKLNYYDAGLLETTVKVVYLQKTADIHLLDRLVINNERYKIDSIGNTIKDILTLQLSPDKQDIE